MTRKQKPTKPSLLLPALILCLLILGGLVVWKYLQSSSAPTVTAVASPPLQPATVTLYFASSTGDSLLAESRELEHCPTEAPCLTELLQALIQGSSSDLVPVLPPQARLLSVDAAGETVTVDFSRELIDYHPGGSLSELLTVAALANTIEKNFPRLRQVRILVEGATLETLKGHVSLREPMVADDSLVQRASAPPAPATTTPDPKQGAR
ncbi:MAG: GerMN domain-containing protein [Trichloromonadaceae bacterium]